MKSFHQDANNKVTDLSQRLKKVQEEGKSLLKDYGEENKKFEELLKDFNNFIKLYKQGENYLEKKEKEKEEINDFWKLVEFDRMEVLIQ